MINMKMYYDNNPEEHCAEFGAPGACWCKVSEKSFGVRVWVYPAGMPFYVRYVSSWREGVALARRLVRLYNQLDREETLEVNLWD